MFYVFSLLMIMIIATIIYFLNMFISMIKNMNYEKMTPYECGFKPISKANLPFSMPFYLMILMFLIFDIEIMLFIPLIFYIKYLKSTLIIFLMIIFILMLIFTLMLEWYYNFLDWIY